MSVKFYMITKNGFGNGKRKEHKAGGHSQHGCQYETGDIVPSEINLATAFPEKFREAYSEEVKAARANDQPGINALDVDGVAVVTTPDPSLGKDVTSEFPEASEAGYLVYKRDKKWWIHDEDDHEFAINEKGLSKSKVISFINQLLEED